MEKKKEFDGKKSTGKKSIRDHVDCQSKRGGAEHPF